MNLYFPSPASLLPHLRLCLGLSVLVLAACGDKGEESTDGDGGDGSGVVDADLDGSPWDEDCNDNAAEVRPGAQESCNGIDDNCDGVIDEEGATGGQTYYLDEDGDGYGGDVMVTACSLPEGATEGTGDCNDTDAAFHPDAIEEDCADPNDYNCDGTVIYVDADGDLSAACEDCDDTNPAMSPDLSEICDDLDNDCDSYVDDEDPSLDPSSGVTYYADADTDTFGDPDVTLLACELPSGYVENPDDCNDADSSAYPEAPEYCDGTDHDCDTLTNEDDSVDAITWYIDSDGDTYGTIAATTTACALPTGYAATDDDCDDADPAISPGALEVCNDLIDNDCDTTATGCEWDATYASTAADAILSGGATSDGVGGVLTWGGDFGTDGFDDLVMGVPGNDSAGSGAGAVYVTSSTLTTLTVSTLSYILKGATAGDAFGSAVSTGDVDGDGVEDLLVGATGYDSSAKTDVGRAYLFHGPLSATMTTGSASNTFTSFIASDKAGAAVAINGDMNGDGFDDLAIGGTGYDNTPLSGVGLVSLFVGASSVSGSLTTSATYRYSGSAASEGLGSVLTFAGDMDGDGYDELAVGSPTLSSSQGAVYVLEGNPTAAVTTMAAAAGATFTGPTSGLAGTSLAAAGDVDGDGYDDLLVGAPGVTSSAGAAYVVTGKATLASAALTASSHKFTGSSAAKAGTSVSGGGDVNGDGYIDLAIGAPGVDTSSSTDTGRTYLILGPIASVALTSSDVILAGDAANDTFGTTVAINGDNTGEGYDDLAIGVPGYTGAATDGGGVFLFNGIGL
jgi:hypothetical protein